MELKIFWCRFNKYYAQKWANFLQWKDWILIASCAVTDNAKRKFIKEVKQQIKKWKQVYLTGCGAFSKNWEIDPAWFYTAYPSLLEYKDKITLLPEDIKFLKSDIITHKEPVESNVSQVKSEKWIVKNDLDWLRIDKDWLKSHAELVSASDAKGDNNLWWNQDNLWLSNENTSTQQSPKSPQNPQIPNNPQISTNLQIPEDFSFPRIWLKKDEFNFSFSGLKAQVNYKIQELEKKYWKITPEIQTKVAYEFQEAVVETLGKKLLKAAKFFEVENIAVVGGVSANLRLKEYIQQNMERFWVKNFYTPVKPLYSTDNAAMIGVVGLLKKM